MCAHVTRDLTRVTSGGHRASAHARLCPVYTVHNNEEFAQTGIPTFFKQREARINTALYGRMDKHDVCVRARLLARSFVRSLVRSCPRRRIGAKPTRTRRRVPIPGTRERARRSSLFPLPSPLRKLSTITLAQQAP